MPTTLDRTLRHFSDSCCPSEHLEQFACSTLSPIHTAWVAMHLEECDLCRARLAIYETAAAPQSEKEAEPARPPERPRSAWLGVIETIGLEVGEGGFQLRAGRLTPILAEPTLLRDGVKVLAGVLELQLDEDTTLELRVERASTVSILLRLTALKPLSAVVEVRDANGMRHARQRLDDVAEFELGPQAWTLQLRLQGSAVELTIPLHVFTVASQ